MRCSRHNGPIIRALRVLDQSLAKFPHQWNRVAMFDINPLGGKWSQQRSKKPFGPLDTPAPAYEAIRAALEGLQRNRPVRKGPWTHRFIYGCLHFEERIDVPANRCRNAAAVSACVPISQVLVNAREFASYQRGELMPQRGKPHYDVAVAFVNAVFGTALTRQHATARIRKLLARNKISIWNRPKEDS